MPSKKLSTSLKKYDKTKAKRDIYISGELGISLNGQKLVEVPNRKGFVYVRLKDNTSELIQAYNASVSPIYGLPVLVVRSVGVYKVVGRNVDRYQNVWGNAPYLPKHGAQHSFNPDINIGGDIVWVYSSQFMPLLGYPSGTSGSPRLTVAPYIIRGLDGAWKYVGNTGTPDTTPYNPTTGSRAVMGLVYLDTVSGNPYLLINSGTYADASLTGSNQVVSYIPQVTNPNWIPIAGIRLLSGTTQLSWNNVYDVRPFLQVIPTGTAGGGSFTWFIQDEGIPLGNATTLNVVGVNADISISGSVARLFITGSTGGGTVNPPITGSFVAQQYGATLGSALTLNGGNGVTVSISGTVAEIDANTILIKTDDLTSQINGTGTSFVTTFVPDPNTARLYYNGVRQRYTFNYSISGSYVQTLFTPTTGSVLLIDYNESYSTGSSLSFMNLQDEGTLIGTVSTLNLVGNGVSGTVVGQTGNIYIGSGRTLIRSIPITSAGTGTISFQNIPQTFSKLIVEFALRSNVAATTTALNISLNNDTTDANYRQIELFGFDGTSVGANGSDGRNITDTINGNTAQANSFTVGIIELPFYYYGGFNKQILARVGHRRDTSSVQEVAYLTALEWENISPVNRVDLSVVAGLYVSGTIANLYGEY